MVKIVEWWQLQQFPEECLPHSWDSSTKRTFTWQLTIKSFFKLRCPSSSSSPPVIIILNVYGRDNNHWVVYKYAPRTKWNVFIRPTYLCGPQRFLTWLPRIEKPHSPNLDLSVYLLFTIYFVGGSYKNFIYDPCVGLAPQTGWSVGRSFISLVFEYLLKGSPVEPVHTKCWAPLLIKCIKFTPSCCRPEYLS